MIVLGGVNQGDLSTMEKYDVDGKLVATLPSMKIARYIIYSIAFKDFVLKFVHVAILSMDFCTKLHA